MALTEQQLSAARWLSKKKTGDWVAQKVRVSPRTIDNWKADEEFRKQVKVFSNEWRRDIRQKMDSDTRLKHLIGRHHRLHDVILQRARDPQMQAVAGGSTGLMTVTYKMLARVDADGNRISEPCPEYAVDSAVLAEMRAIEREIAILRGETKPVKIDYDELESGPETEELGKVLTGDQLESLAKIIEGMLAASPKLKAIDVAKTE